MTPAADGSETQFAGSALGMDARLAGVSIVLGSTALTRTFACRTSAATARARATTADLDAPYAAAPAAVAGCSTTRDPTTTMLPRLRATIAGRSARKPRYAVS